MGMSGLKCHVRDRDDRKLMFMLDEQKVHQVGRQAFAIKVRIFVFVCILWMTFLCTAKDFNGASCTKMLNGEKIFIPNDIYVTCDFNGVGF